MDMQQNNLLEKILTKEDLVKHFKMMGIEKGMTIEVHSSLKSFGYVCGGAQAVVDALLEVVSYEGTVLMPMQTGDNSEPSYWQNPPIAHELQKEVRLHMPPYHKKESELRKMGAIANNFRRRDGVVYSNHPTVALAAWGKYAKLLCNRQSLHFGLGEESPLARLYELKGYVLLLGVDYDNCTALHLAEYRSDIRPIILQGAAVELNGARVWKKYLDIELDSTSFVDIGNKLEQNNLVSILKIGEAQCKFFKMNTAVDYAVDYFETSK